MERPRLLPLGPSFGPHGARALSGVPRLCPKGVKASQDYQGSKGVPRLPWKIAKPEIM